ncbi:hypothetical protein GGI20_003013 [Coemansia sp. BCRC 34301]|nr:hypothetical protein GGI20_003013 [Coemansia sp. BCRC 34301]
MAKHQAHLECQVAAANAFTADLAQDHFICNGENKRTLDQSPYELMPSAARVAHSGEPLSATDFARFLARDKEICDLSVYFAHALRPLDVYLERIPVYLARDETMAEEFRQLLDVVSVYFRILQ